MKPYVVIIKQFKDGKIVLTEQELKDIVQRAYNDGYNEGASKTWWSPTITYTGNGGNTPPTYDYNITPNPIYDPYRITCDTNTTSARYTGDLNEKTKSN